MRQPRLESPCLFSVGRGSPCWCSRAAGSLQSQWEPSIRHVKPRLVSAARGTLPSGAAEPQLPPDAARVPHLISAIVLLFQRHVGLASPTLQAAAPVEHRTSSPVALPPFHLADSNPYLSTAGIFWGAINSRSLAAVPCLKLLLGSSLGSGHVPGSEPSPRTASQNMLTICYQIKCKGELVK